MKDLGLALTDKVEWVTENWILSVHQDTNIESARQLAYEAVRNSLPEVLKELGALLSRYQTGSPRNLENKSLYHGFVRAQQGYDTAEIVREYRLLRQVVLDALEPELLTGSPREILRATNLIHDVLDKIITASIESYVEARLTELRQMQSQLTLTNQELTRLIQTQKENLSFMAHELKTPLNSIIGHSSLLLQQQRKKLKAKDTATNLDQLERVLRNGRKLLQIVNDTLEISRYNEGQMRLTLMPLNVEELLLEILEDGMEPLALEKELALKISIDIGAEPIMGDGLRLQQLVTNLVTNAIRYTESGEVSFTARWVDATTWEILVADTGIGISEEAQSRIFDPYVQADPQQQSTASSGLGLAIVQRIVTLMEGTISVASQPGEGSTFTVVLPLIRPED